MAVVFLDGDFLPSDKACVSIHDWGFQYGWGVFTSVLVKEGVLINSELHEERLRSNCQMLDIYPALPALSDMLELIRLNEANQGEWKLKIGIRAQCSADFPKPASLYMTLAPLDKTSPAWRLISHSGSRSAILSRCKSFSYAEHSVLRQQALKKSADDMLLLDEVGHILETTTASIFWVADGKLYHPSFDLPLLPGTALKALCSQLSGRSGIEIKSCKIRLEEVPAHASWYAINALRGVVPIVQIDDKLLPKNENLLRFFVSL